MSTFEFLLLHMLKFTISTEADFVTLSCNFCVKVAYLVGGFATSYPVSFN